jgi:peptide/nickel transport system substrate-binding protein
VIHQFTTKQFSFFSGIISVFIAIGLAACSATVGETPATPTRLLYGLSLAPSGIDPHINASSELGIPLSSVYDTLVFLDEESDQFVPGLAEEWQVSDDGVVYTFSLRQDVVFHDGELFNAEAVKFNFDRITSPELASQKARFMLGSYNRTEVVDEYTVKIHLDEPFAPLLDSLSQVYLGMASPAAVEKWGSEYQLHQVGTGPYIFAEYTPGDRLLLKANRNYKWGPTLYQNETAQVDEIEFRFLTDPATRSAALETGEIQIMGEIPPQDVSRLEAGGEAAILPEPIPGLSLLFFLNSARPPLDELPVRQALLYGADRQAIITTVFRDYSPVAYGPLTAVTFSYDPAVKEFYPFDPALAATLLDEAGWVDSDGDGVRERNGEPLVLEMYLMGWGSMPEVGQLLAAQWQEIGIGINSRIVSYPEALAIGGDGEHHLIPFTLGGSDPDILRTFFHAEAQFNWSKINDARLNDQLTEAAQTSDRQERQELYRQVQQEIMAQALVLPVRDYVNLNGFNKQVNGLQFDAQGWFPRLIDVTLETQ